MHRLARTYLQLIFRYLFSKASIILLSGTSIHSFQCL